MLNFEISKTKPKLQNNHIVALQKQRHYFSVLISILLLCGSTMYSQDIPPKNEVDIKANEVSDSITVSVKPIIEFIGVRIS